MAGQVTEGMRRQLQGSPINLLASPINVEQATRQCDIVINYGGHGVKALALLTGKPLLQIPIAVEQFLLASCVAKLGAGIFIPGGNQQTFADALSALIHRPQYCTSSEAFARLHADHDPQLLADRIAAQLKSALM